MSRGFRNLVRVPRYRPVRMCALAALQITRPRCIRQAPSAESRIAFLADRINADKLRGMMHLVTLP